MTKTSLFLPLALTLCLALPACLSGFDTEGTELQPSENSPPPQNTDTPDLDDMDATDQGSPDNPDTEDLDNPNNPENPDTDEADQPDPDPNACQEDAQCATSLPGTQSRCQDGKCELSCQTGWANCNEDLELDGCETPLNTPDNCGSCGQSCNAPNASEFTCTPSGTCQILSCTGPYADLDQNPDNGCETPLPQSANIQAVTNVHHGLNIQWTQRAEGSTPLAYEFRWGPPEDPTQNTQRVSASLLTEQSATVGPVENSGPLSVSMIPLGSNDLPGPPSESVSHEFVPQGWFEVLPSHPFTQAVTRPSEPFGRAHISGTSISFENPLTDARIPGKVPTSSVLVGNFVSEGPFAGLGIMAGRGQVIVTRDAGMTWSHTPSTHEIGANDNIFGALATHDGRLYLAKNDELLYSEDFGDAWDIVSGSNAGTAWSFGYSLGEESFFFGTEDDTTQIISLHEFPPSIRVIPETEGLPHHIHMLDQDRGFLSTSASFYKTEDRWLTTERIELPDGGNRNMRPFRFAFDAQGQNGLILSAHHDGWFSTDGGNSWNILEFPPEGDSAGTWYSVSSIPASDDAHFVVLSDAGRRYKVTPSGRWAIEDRSSVLPTDLVAVTGASIDDRLTFLAADGRAWTASTPANPGEPVQLPYNGANPEWNHATYIRGLDLYVALGDNGNLARRRGIASPWEPLSTRSGDLLRGAAFNEQGQGWIYGEESDDGSPILYTVEINDTSFEYSRYELSALSSEPLHLGTIADIQLEDDGLKVLLLMNLNDRPPARSILYKGSRPTPTGPTSWEPIYSISEDLRAITPQPGYSETYWLAGKDTVITLQNGDPSYADLELPEALNARRRSEDAPIFADIHFPHSKFKGWIVTEDGWVGHTTNEGSSWTWDRALGYHASRTGATQMLFIDPDEARGVLVGSNNGAAITHNAGIPNPRTR